MKYISFEEWKSQQGYPSDNNNRAFDNPENVCDGTCDSCLYRDYQSDIEDLTEAYEDYYTIVDIACLFDETIETIEKWTEEGRMYYVVEDSEYYFPIEQFNSIEKMNEIDPTFIARREEDLKKLNNNLEELS